MSDANTSPHGAVQQLIEQRLDAIDQALLGLLPRQERLAAVAHVESRIRELVAASPALAAKMNVPTQGSNISDSVTETATFLPHTPCFALPWGGQIPSTKKRRSRLAISAGVLGIFACAMLLATPVTYLTVAMLGEVLGEIAALAFMGAHAVAVGLGGAAAVGLGIAALVLLSRRRESLAGHGWAIAGMCAGSLPMLVGCVAVLYIGLQSGVLEYVTAFGMPVACSADSATEAATPEASGPVTMSIGPVYQGLQSPALPQSTTVQTVGHEAPAAASQVPILGGSTFVPTSPVCPHVPSHPDPAPHAESLPQFESHPTPCPEPNVEPVSMPESAPSI